MAKVSLPLLVCPPGFTHSSGFEADKPHNSLIIKPGSEYPLHRLLIKKWYYVAKSGFCYLYLPHI